MAQHEIAVYLLSDQEKNLRSINALLLDWLKSFPDHPEDGKHTARSVREYLKNIFKTLGGENSDIWFNDAEELGAFLASCFAEIPGTELFDFEKKTITKRASDDLGTSAIQLRNGFVGVKENISDDNKKKIEIRYGVVLPSP